MTACPSTASAGLTPSQAIAFWVWLETAARDVEHQVRVTEPSDYRSQLKHEVSTLWDNRWGFEEYLSPGAAVEGESPLHARLRQGVTPELLREYLAAADGRATRLGYREDTAGLYAWTSRFLTENIMRCERPTRGRDAATRPPSRRGDRRRTRPGGLSGENALAFWGWTATWREVLKRHRGTDADAGSRYAVEAFDDALSALRSTLPRPVGVARTGWTYGALEAGLDEASTRRLDLFLRGHRDEYRAAALRGSSRADLMEQTYAALASELHRLAGTTEAEVDAALARRVRRRARPTFDDPRGFEAWLAVEGRDKLIDFPWGFVCLGPGYEIEQLAAGPGEEKVQVRGIFVDAHCGFKDLADVESIFENCREALADVGKVPIAVTARSWGFELNPRENHAIPRLGISAMAVPQGAPPPVSPDELRAQLVRAAALLIDISRFPSSRLRATCLRLKHRARSSGQVASVIRRMLELDHIRANVRAGMRHGRPAVHVETPARNVPYACKALYGSSATDAQATSPDGVRWGAVQVTIATHCEHGVEGWGTRRRRSVVQHA